MKKNIILMSIVFLLCIFAPAFSASPIIIEEKAAPPARKESDSLIIQKFTEAALGNFTENSGFGFNTSILASRIQDYAAQITGTLLKGGISLKETGEIMDKLSIWYGGALSDIYEGKNYANAIHAYIDKISELFSKKKLSLPLQSQLVSQTSYQLEQMNSFFSDFQ